MRLKIPFVLTLLNIILGVGIAILFGINEDYFKDQIAAGLDQNQKIQAIVDPVERKNKIDAEKKKNWRYYQRYHFHATGIGAMSLGILLLLLFVDAPKNLKLLAQYFTSVGGFFYPFVWLFAGIFGPIMGRSEAKEAFKAFGLMGGVFLIGALITLQLVIQYKLKTEVRQNLT